jgi:3-oxoacyl-[acyl-carrier-protein] synthase II
MPSRPERVVVTGLGMVTPFGVGHERFWDGVLASRSAARRIESFDVRGFPSPFACFIDRAAFDPEAYISNRKSIKLMSRATQFAVAASTLALEDAGLHPNQRVPERCGVVHGAGGVGLHDLDYLDAMKAIATELSRGAAEPNVIELACRHLNPLTPLKMLPNVAAAHIAIEHGFRGESHTVCTACTSGTQAIGQALRILREGRADLILAGGSDAMVNPMGLAAFGMLGVLSTRGDDPARASRPFDRSRDGFVMGEGSAMLVLETLAHARHRGAEIRAEVRGFGCCSDAFRITDEREDGSGCSDAMTRALEDAESPGESIQYVNAHGTGTRMNDRTEVIALKRVFGAHARSLAVSSTKSQIGHLVAAAGAVEAAACVLALCNQVLPPTINHQHPDPECDLDVVPNVPRAAALTQVLSNSFGFGGQNACLVFGRLN